MRTDRIPVASRGGGVEAALAQVEKVAVYKELPDKSALHLRLLAEEMMAMLRAIAGDVNGEFWIEDEAGVYALHLRAESLMDIRQREQLLSAASSGRNEAAKGFMGRLRCFFESSGGVTLFPGSVMPSSIPQGYSSYVWSMVDYRDMLQAYAGEHREGAQEAWDELEKSVVSQIADDVKVSILGREVEMVILKKLS